MKYGVVWFNPYLFLRFLWKYKYTFIMYDWFQNENLDERFKDYRVYFLTRMQYIQCTYRIEHEHISNSIYTFRYSKNDVIFHKYICIHIHKYIHKHIHTYTYSDWRSGDCGFDPRRIGYILSWILIMKYFLGSVAPFRWFKKGNCQFLAKDCAQYWLTVKRTKPAQ